MKFAHLEGQVTSKYLYVMNSKVARESTTVFAGAVLAKELRAQGRLQAENIRSAYDGEE